MVAEFTTEQILSIRRSVIPRALVAPGVRAGAGSERNDEHQPSLMAARSARSGPNQMDFDQPSSGQAATTVNEMDFEQPDSSDVGGGGGGGGGGNTILPPPPDFPVPSPKNVQGDVYTIFPKSVEDFIFFTISDARAFKQWLRTYKPTNSQDVCENLSSIYVKKTEEDTSRCRLAQTQIAFTRKGLDFLGETEKVQDLYFDRGPQINDKKLLSDAGVWNTVFSDARIHAVILVAADCEGTMKSKVDELLAQLRPCIANPTTDVTIVSGKSRPEKLKGFEHFGYKDGISQPALRGLTDTCSVPGQLKVDPGVIVMGYKGDPTFDNPDLPQRPAWTKDGTIMVFRKLQQDVPEFDRYLEDNGKRWRDFVPREHKGNVQLTDKEGAALFGAQMFGRWKSGAPLQNFPIRDDEAAARDKCQRNNFDYSVKGETTPSNLCCPFTAHIRKVAPRQLDPYIQRRYIEGAAVIRAGITYGPEVTDDERRFKKTDPTPSMERGLLYVCYQSSLAMGFVLHAVGFGGNDYFPTTDLIPVKHGQDPIIGSPPPKLAITIKGLEGREHINLEAISKDADSSFVIPGVTQEFFVTSKGGEYFFVPSVSTLQRLANK